MFIDSLFETNDIHDIERRWYSEIDQSINGFDYEYLTSTTDEQVTEHYLSVYKKELLNIEFDAKKLIEESTKIDVTGNILYSTGRNSPCYIDGVSYRVVMPFSGDSDLWFIRPRNSYLRTFRGTVRPFDNEVEIVIPDKIPAHDLKAGNADKVRSIIDHELELVRKMVEHVNNDVDRFNGSIGGYVQNSLAKKRQRASAKNEFMKSINIPIYKSNHAPNTNPIPLKRHIVQLPKSRKNRETQYEILNADYENILKVIRHMGRSFESAPKGISKLDEEEIRDVINASLNGYFYGEAKGEVFRKEGKTDILIEFENRAAFVAECKLWHGAKAIAKALDQLLGYLTWRDCKVSLIVFNKINAGFNELQAKMKESLQNHNKYIKEESTQDSGEWRIKYRSTDDDEREITVHVFFFNIYSDK